MAAGLAALALPTHEHASVDVLDAPHVVCWVRAGRTRAVEIERSPRRTTVGTLTQLDAADGWTPNQDDHRLTDT